jgi:DNA polymerase V
MVKNTIFIGSEGIERNWRSIANRRSPRYTTRWNELVKVSCDSF